MSQSIKRRAVRAVRIGRVVVGGHAPVVVQSMTNTDTADYVATAVQCAELARAGSELVRITVNTPEAAAGVPKIREQLDRMGVDVPLIGDFHYNGHRLLLDNPACAEALAKYRINPGNVGFGKKKDEQFAQMIELACQIQCPAFFFRPADWSTERPVKLLRGREFRGRFPGFPDMQHRLLTMHDRFRHQPGTGTKCSGCFTATIPLQHGELVSRVQPDQCGHVGGCNPGPHQVDQPLLQFLIPFGTGDQLGNSGQHVQATVCIAISDLGECLPAEGHFFHRMARRGAGFPAQ